MIIQGQKSSIILQSAGTIPKKSRTKRLQCGGELVMCVCTIFVAQYSSPAERPSVAGAFTIFPGGCPTDFWQQNQIAFTSFFNKNLGFPTTSFFFL